MCTILSLLSHLLSFGLLLLLPVLVLSLLLPLLLHVHSLPYFSHVTLAFGTPQAL